MPQFRVFLAKLSEANQAMASLGPGKVNEDENNTTGSELAFRCFLYPTRYCRAGIDKSVLYWNVSVISGCDG